MANIILLISNMNDLPIVYIGDININLLDKYNPVVIQVITSN